MFIRKRNIAIAAAVLSFALVFTGAGAAIAARNEFTTGFGVSGVAAATQNDAKAFTSTAWTTVETVTVGGNLGRFVVARFTAESVCTGPGGWCAVRILIDGSEGSPVAGTDFAFDSTDNGTANASWESHSVERVRATGGGPSTVTVQVALVSGATSIRLDDWTLTATKVAP